MFEHLKNFEVGQAMSWLDMPELGKSARILLKPATEANRPYYNAMLKLSSKRARQLARGGMISVEDLEKNRDEDRILYPKHVLAGWEGVQDSDGVEVPFSLDNAKELCQVLPKHLFDRIRNHAATPEQFYPEDELPPDPVELAGNSESGSASN